MKNIADNLATAIAQSSPNDKLAVLVTTNGPQPQGFGLQGFDGLEGLYHGQLDASEIKKLARHPDVKAVELDTENTIQ